MIYIIIVQGGIILALSWALVKATVELAHRRVDIDDLAETAAEISAKTHVSYDTAFQSLVTLTYTIPDRIGKKRKKQ